MIYQIKNVGNGWYDFSQVPQGYIKIHNINCGTKRKAINILKRITGEKKPKYCIETNVQEIWDKGRQI